MDSREKASTQGQASQSAASQDSASVTAELRLLGHTIGLKTKGADPELIAEVVEVVSARLEAVEKRLTSHKIPHQVTLLAMLDLAEEYVRAKRRTQAFKDEVESHSERILSALT